MVAGLLSVIVPVYNCEQYLERSIKSILSQTYSKLELILVDDGSTDGSGMICDSYAKTDFRIRVIHKKNGGQQDARSAGIELAEGQYIGFVDADDWIDPFMYEELLGEMGDNDLVTSGVLRYDKSEKIIGKWIDLLPEGIYKERNELQYLYDNLIVSKLYQSGTVIGGIMNNLYCKVYRTDIVKKIYQNANIHIKMEEDLLFCIMYVLQCRSIKVTHNCYYHYTDNDNSIVRSANMQYLRERNDFYLAVEKALDGHWMAESLKGQLQRRVMYSVISGMGSCMNFEEENCLPIYVYPDEEMLYEKKIVLFGAGKVGKNYYRAMKNNCRLTIVKWIDNYAAGKQIMGRNIGNPTDILDLDYNLVVCAVQNEGQAEIMKNQLVQMGVAANRIVWKTPKNQIADMLLK